METCFFLSFPLLSFILGLPAFLVLAVPALHLLPWLKHAHPRTAALVGAGSAPIVGFCLYLLGYLPEITYSERIARLFFAAIALWAAIASWLYQYTRKLR